MSEKRALEDTNANVDPTRVLTAGDSDSHAKLEAGDAEQRAAEQSQLDGDDAPPPTRLYKRRWLFVLLFSSYSLCNSY